jgi:hypothetical protein
MPFPDGGGKSQVSFFGGTSARWSPQGNELFYEKWDNEDRSMSFMIVSVETKGTFKAGRPRKLFNAPQGVDIRFFAVSSDGQRFLTVQRGESGECPQTTITVVENWIKEFEG